MSAPASSGRPLKATIRTEAFLHNIELAQQQSPESQVLVVIKADAYGHGVLPLARAVQGRSLAVATPGEAELLLSAGIRNEIWVLEGPFSRKCLELESPDNSIVWVIHDVSQLEWLEQSCDESSAIRIWLKIDTGMHRLGFPAEQVPETLQRIARQTGIQLEGIMTHFANSEFTGDESVKAQITRFDQVIEANALESLPQSLCNSAGILNWPEARRQWLRPGISLYGGYATSEVPYRAVMTLSSAVMALRWVEPGESVGYGSTWTASRRSLIATIAVGYGDGYPRHATNGTPVLVNGQRAPMAGRVSMDMITVDVTDIAGVEVGSEVELWGDALPVDEVADHAGTISYELLTQVTARVPREYH